MMAMRFHILLSMRSLDEYLQSLDGLLSASNPCESDRRYKPKRQPQQAVLHLQR